MPKINDPDVVPVVLPNLPQRLRELRMEMGWTLEDLVPILGVAQKAVISNWEATNQRRRTPPLTTLLVLQRWYGVSLDYLIGQPNAERDSPAVKVGKRLLREKLRQLSGLDLAPPSDRARVALNLAYEVAPEAFFPGRTVAFLSLGDDDMAELMDDGVWPDQILERLAELVGVKVDWFYVAAPMEVLQTVE